MEELDLSYNHIVDFPDLSSVRLTLRKLRLNENFITSIAPSLLDLPYVKKLAIQDNPLTHWPDFSSVGTSATNSNLNINDYPDVAFQITNVCHFYAVWLEFEIRTVLPSIICPAGSKLSTVSFRFVNLDNSFDLEPLADMNVGMLYLTFNELTEFPDLPMSLRNTVGILNLMDNPMVSINATFLQGFDSLTQLDLSNTLLSTVPPELFHVAGKIVLKSTPISMNELTWNQNLCNTSTLNELDLRNAFNSLAELPPLKGALWQRSTSLTINLKQVCNFTFICIAIESYLPKTCAGM